MGLGLGGSQDLQLSDWINWGERSFWYFNQYFESPELIVTDNQMLSYSQDCGNKLVESGCVSQEEVDNKTFVHVFVVVDIFNQMTFLLVCWCFQLSIYVRRRWTGWRTTRWRRACSKWRTTFSLGTQPSVPLSSRNQIDHIDMYDLDFWWANAMHFQVLPTADGSLTHRDSCLWEGNLATKLKLQIHIIF